MYYIRGGSLTKAFNIISVRIGFFNDAIPLPSPYPLPFFLLSFLPFETNRESICAFEKQAFGKKFRFEILFKGFQNIFFRK